MGRAAAIRLAPAERYAFDAAGQICRRHAPDLYRAMLFLPRRKRQAACALYSFLRIACPAAGSAHEAARSAAAQAGGASCGCAASVMDLRLQWSSACLEQAYAGTLSPPAGDARAERAALYAFQQTLKRYRIPRDCFEQLLEGWRADLEVRRYATWRALEKHCQQVAGGLALIFSAVLGLTHSDAFAQARRLGVALRLAGILGAVADDAQRGWVYLPQEDLVAFRYAQRDLERRLANASFCALMRFEVERARALLREGAEAIGFLADEGSRLAVSLVAVAHAQMLREIERRGYDVLSRPPPARRWAALRDLPAAWRLARRLGAPGTGPDARLPSGVL